MYGSNNKHVHAVPIGVCCRSIDFDLSENESIVFNIVIEGGCNGNIKALCRLCEAQSPSTIISKCEDILCGNKGTSCPAKLAKAVLYATSTEPVDTNEFELFEMSSSINRKVVSPIPVPKDVDVTKKYKFILF